MKAHFLILLPLIAVIFVCSSNSINKNDKKNSLPNKSLSFVEQNGKLSVKGVNLVNENDKTIVLRGVSYGWHNWWPRFYNSSTVKLFADDWNCKVVRAAMGVDPKKGYIDDPNFSIECVTQVVDAAIANGIYVIIDWHSHTIKTDQAITFFSKMAEKYKDYPNVIYEIFNEPERDSWSDVKTYSIKLIETIRAIDKDNIILVGSPHWDQDVHIVADDPILGFDNIMYSLHFYAATHGQFLRERGDYAIKKGLPLFVPECAGMEATGDGQINYSEWQNWLNWMKNNNISWVAWSIADKNESCSMLLPSASTTGNWKNEDLKEWGKMIKKELSLD